MNKTIRINKIFILIKHLIHLAKFKIIIVIKINIKIKPTKITIYLHLTFPSTIHNLPIQLILTILNKITLIIKANIIYPLLNKQKNKHNKTNLV
jgi:hypothetical protein